MSLYEDIGIEPSTNDQLAAEEVKASPSVSSTPSTTAQNLAVNKINLTFLKSQLEAKKALLQNAATHHQQQQQKVPTDPLPPVLLAQPPLLQQRLQQKQKSSIFKLKPHKAVPLPLDSSGAFSIVPKELKEDKIFLFNEIMVEDEYNPTCPTDYVAFKAKREQQKLKEKIAKDIAERLAKETTEEEEKRKRGAAIAPPAAFHQEDNKQQTLKDEERMTDKIDSVKLPQFGKGFSRGLGVAANIMSRMGYREGAGLGAKEQGISRPLEVQRTGKNIGLIVAEEKASNVVTHIGNEQTSSQDKKNVTDAVVGWSEQNIEQPITPITELLKSATKIVLLRNMVLPQQLDADFERELREEMAKYGQLVNLLLHQVANAVDSEAVRVFLEFSNQAQAIKAVVDLNGRFFGGRQVRALFYPLDDYNQRNLDAEILT